MREVVVVRMLEYQVDIVGVFIWRFETPAAVKCPTAGGRGVVVMIEDEDGVVGEQTVCIFVTEREERGSSGRGMGFLLGTVL